MKKFILFAFAALTMGRVSAQHGNYRHGEHSHNYNGRNNSFICSYYGEPINTSVVGFASSNEAKNVINQIIDVIGLQPTFDIRSANIPNAAAVVQGSTRYILYNPNFIASIEKAAGNKWASIAILAHEIGHHLNGHTISGLGSRPNIELEADEFSGFVLRKMGASLEQAQLAMKVAADVKASSTHPGKNDRLEFIAYGWNKADAQMTGKAMASRPVYQPQRTTQPVATHSRGTVLSDKTIAYDVTFIADRVNKYYITTLNDLVKVHGGQVAVVAKLMSTKRQDYPWMLYASANDYFLIDNQNNILTIQGKVIGNVRAHRKPNEWNYSM
jgi:hypothetical protein